MSKRPERNHKSPADALADLRKGHREASFMGEEEGRKYLEKVLGSQHSLPNAVKFFAYDLLAEATHDADPERCLEAVAEAKRHLEAVKEDAAREFMNYLPELRFCERGIGVHSERGEIEEALALCDLALELGLEPRAYEGKRRSLERRL